MAISKLKRWFLDKDPLKVDNYRGNRLDNKFGRVGLVSLVRSNDEIENIMSFYRELVSIHNEVSCIIFTNRKDLENEFLIKKSESNWVGKPLGTQVESFLGKDFDQIWFATYTFNIPIQYILRNSKSHLKLGMFAKETWNYCHLFVDLKERSIITVIKELKEAMHKINTNG